MAGSVPVLVLSASSDVVDKVLLLELGADDYGTKLFSPSELMARVRASIHRLNREMSLAFRNSKTSLPNLASRSKKSTGSDREAAERRAVVARSNRSSVAPVTLKCRTRRRPCVMTKSNRGCETSGSER